MDSLQFLSNALWSTLPRAHSRLSLHPPLFHIFSPFLICLIFSHCLILIRTFKHRKFSTKFLGFWWFMHYCWQILPSKLMHLFFNFLRLQSRLCRLFADLSLFGCMGASLNVREDIHRKNVYFRALPEWWGGVYPCPIFLALFDQVKVPIRASFLVILVIIIIKITTMIIIIIITTIIIIVGIVFGHTRKILFLTSEPTCPNRGPFGGGRGVKVTWYSGSFAGKFRTVSGLWYLKGNLGNFLSAQSFSWPQTIWPSLN